MGMIKGTGGEPYVVDVVYGDITTTVTSNNCQALTQLFGQLGSPEPIAGCAALLCISLAFYDRARVAEWPGVQNLRNPVRLARGTTKRRS
jgi:hypothetical protein